MVMGRHLTAFLAVLFVILPMVASSPAHTLEAPVTATTDLALEPEGKEYSEQHKEIKELLRSIESQWNAHNLEGVMSYYADDYVNNDGLDKKAVSALTQDFWKTYPDATSTSQTKQIRIEGPFVTVESRDTAYGTTAKEMPGIGTKGELRSISEGQLYMKKLGSNWKIIGDRIDYEKVRVAFGLAKQVNALFSAPEQVKAGHQYCAKLEVTLPPGLTAVGSITSQPLQYPQPQPTDAWRPLESSAATLERVLGANSQNRNELLMATIGITNPTRNSLMGIAFLTRRLNVIPSMEDNEPSATSHSSTEKGHVTDKSK